MCLPVNSRFVALPDDSTSSRSFEGPDSLCFISLLRLRGAHWLHFLVRGPDCFRCGLLQVFTTPPRKHQCWDTVRRKPFRVIRRYWTRIDSIRCDEENWKFFRRRPSPNRIEPRLVTVMVRLLSGRPFSVSSSEIEFSYRHTLRRFVLRVAS
jgi:hypothetical protein